MASKARTAWQTLKDTKIKVKYPALYKEFNQGLGPALDSFETAAYKKIKQGMSDSDAVKAVAAERAKVNGILKKYSQAVTKAGASKDLPTNIFGSGSGIDRYMGRFVLAVAMGKDANSAHSWASWPK